MWKTFIDILKTVVILILLIVGVLVLPFFLVAMITLSVGYVIYAVIHDARINQEEEKNHVQT